jgi:hypothetical protein
VTLSPVTKSKFQVKTGNWFLRRKNKHRQIQLSY